MQSRSKVAASSTHACSIEKSAIGQQNVRGQGHREDVTRTKEGWEWALKNAFFVPQTCKAIFYALNPICEPHM